MEKNNFIGKTKEEALNLAKETLGCSEKDIFYNEIETKGGLFKSKKVEIQAIKRETVIKEAKEFLKKIINLMGVEVNFEVKERDEAIMITAFCDNNNILIGKQGRTIGALSIILKQYLYNELGFNVNILLDVSDYKLKNQQRLERLAKKLAREVKISKVEVKLDPMNSYERRIIHTTLGENKYVTTESVGEEPNRAVVIKPKEIVEKEN